MTELLALSVSVAILGGIWAFIALGPLGGFALVWVGFIAAGCFFAAGGDIKALSKNRRHDLWRYRCLDCASNRLQGSGACVGNSLAGNRRWSDGLLSRYRRLRRSALVRPSQCLRVCGAGGLHVVGGQTGCADGRGQLKSAVSHRPLLHPGRCAGVPDGAISWCAETSTNFGAKHPLTQSGELIVLSFKPRSVAGAFPLGSSRSPYRSGRSTHWLKIKNPAAPAVKREAEEDWGGKRKSTQPRP